MKKIFIKYIIFVIVGFALLQLSCTKDAERGNPLDPNSKNYINTGEINGQVLSFYTPFSPLADADVLIEPVSLLIKTGSDGRFNVRDLNPGLYTVTAKRAGYTEASDTVSVVAQNISPIFLYMDGVPFINSFTVKTARISRWVPSTDLLRMEVEATASDPDGTGDISSIQIEIPAVNLTDNLTATFPTGRFAKTFSQNDLPGKNLYNIVGDEIFLTAIDRNGIQSETKTTQIVRIIDEVATQLEPIGQDEISNNQPILKWYSEKEPPFNFNFKVDLSQYDSGVTTNIWSRSGIAADSVQVTNILSAGRYVWTVTIVDEYGNWSRSKEAAFAVR